ncbi:MAG: hypothetical protein WA941_08595 [Nitrososphaeraceae archaeon]
MSKEKIICPQCQREGKKSRVYIYSMPGPHPTGGYWNEDGDFVEFSIEFPEPWYICTNFPPHIWQPVRKD